MSDLSSTLSVLAIALSGLALSSNASLATSISKRLTPTSSHQVNLSNHLAQVAAPSTTGQEQQLPQLVETAVRRAAAQASNQAMDAIRIGDYKAEVWPNSCLGLGGPTELCSQSLVSGWYVTASDGRQTWLYRASANGKLLRPDPQGLRRLQAQQQPATSRQFIEPAEPTSTAPNLGDRQLPEARITPENGYVNITFINRISSAIIFEVIDQTGARQLAGDRATRLTNLATPITITLNREDGGLLRILPRQQGAANALEVFLDAEIDLGLDRSTLTIENDGAVFLN